jgi:hypothetical protein
MHELRKIQFPKQNRVFLAQDYDKMMDTFKEEKNAILSVFLAKTGHYLEFGWDFVETENMLVAKEEYKETNDPVGNYIRLRYEPSDDDCTMEQKASPTGSRARSFWQRDATAAPHHGDAMTGGLTRGG